MKRKYLLLVIFALGVIACKGQTKNAQESIISVEVKKDTAMYVPVRITGGPGRIEWDFDEYTIKNDKDLFFNVLRYKDLYSDEAGKLRKENLELYLEKNRNLLYTREECKIALERIINSSINNTDEDYFKTLGRAIIRYKNRSTTIYDRYACLPAIDIMALRHGDLMGTAYGIWLEPSDFVKKFERFNLDSLSLEDIPYYTLFPTDIDPSFNCRKSTTITEKTICRDAELANLDRELFLLYKKIKKNETIIQSQRNWIKNREEQIEKLDTHEERVKLIKSLYLDRIEELQKF